MGAPILKVHYEPFMNETLFQTSNLCTIYYEMLIHNSSQAFNAGIIRIF